MTKPQPLPDPLSLLPPSPPPLSRERSGSRVDRGASGPFPLQPSARLPLGSPGGAYGWPATRPSWTHVEKPFISRIIFFLCSSPAVPILPHSALPKAWAFRIRPAHWLREAEM